VKRMYMLDTNICSFVMREQPESLLGKFQQTVKNKDRLVVSAITYAELKFGAIGKKASPKHATIVAEFIDRIDAVLPWDKAAVDATTIVKQLLADMGTPIGPNDAAIAGHAISAGCVVVTNNTREFNRVKDLTVEDWSTDV